MGFSGNVSDGINFDFDLGLYSFSAPIRTYVRSLTEGDAQSPFLGRLCFGFTLLNYKYFIGEHHFGFLNTELFFIVNYPGDYWSIMSDGFLCGPFVSNHLLVNGKGELRDVFCSGIKLYLMLPETFFNLINFEIGYKMINGPGFTGNSDNFYFRIGVDAVVVSLVLINAKEIFDMLLW